jgi:hypothetical protein
MSVVEHNAMDDCGVVFHHAHDHSVLYAQSVLPGGSRMMVRVTAHESSQST